MATSCEIKDKVRFNFSASQVVVSTSSYPWSVKPSFSFVSYFFPIRGNKRLSYLTVASILLFLLWITLAQIAPSRASFVYLTVFLATQNVAAAMLDVVVNVVVAGAARARRIDFDLHPISWFSMIFGGIVGSICGVLGLPVFNVEGIFLFLSVFPLLQLLACDLIDVKTRNRVATAIDSYNLLKFDYWMIIIDVLEESHVEMDCYGILNGISEEEYSDTIMLQAVVKERHVSDYDGVATVLRLPWRIDHGEGKVEKFLAPPTEEFKRQHDDEDDEDWIEIGQNGLEKDSELVENIGGSDIKEDMHKSFISDADDPMEDLHLQVKELPRNSEQLNEKPYSSCGQSKVFKGEQVVQRGLWQELRSTVADILKQPVLMQSTLWFLVTQLVIPNSSFTMLCCQTDGLQVESSFLRVSPMVIWGILIMTTFLFNQYLKNLPLRRIKPWYAPLFVRNFYNLLDPGCLFSYLPTVMGCKKGGALTHSPCSSLTNSTHNFKRLMSFFQPLITVVASS